MKLCLAKICVLCLFVATVAVPATVFGDEIVISGNEHVVTVGDFDFTPVNTETIGSLAGLHAGHQGEITAGELWKHFNDRGLDSVENLTICMDWAPGQASNNLALSSLKLKIEDPEFKGRLITNVSLGDNSLVVPDYEVSPLKPEARLGVALGYDFMKRFSSESQAKIKLDFGDTNATGVGSPTFSFDSSSQRSPTVSWIKLAAFVMFWGIIFKCLAVLTAPKPTLPSQRKVVSA
jgi:hypothetical protein